MRRLNLFLWLLLVLVGVALLYLGSKRNRSTSQPEQKKAGFKETSSKGKSSESPYNQVRLVDEETLQPLAQCEVEVLRESEMSWILVTGVLIPQISYKSLWHSRTDSSGFVKLPKDLALAGCVLRVKPKGYPRCFIKNWVRQRVLKVKKGGDFRFFGLRAPGTPLLTLSEYGSLKLGQIDSKGGCVFRNLPAGRYAVFLGDPAVAGIARPKGDLSKVKLPDYPYEIRPGEVTEVDLKYLAQATATLEGQIEGLTGSLDLILKARGMPSERTHRIHGEGKFCFPFLPPGAYQLLVVPPLGRVKQFSLELAAGETRSLKLSLPFASVAGVVLRGGERKPAPGLKVAIQPLEGTGILHAITDRQGSFRFEGLLPGEYKLSIQSEKQGKPLYSRQLRVAEGELKLQIKTGR